MSYRDPVEPAVRESEDFKKHVTRIPKLRRPLFEKVAAGNASPREAIKAKCQECCGYESIVERISGCTILKCPLWTFRPYQDESEAEDSVEEQEITENP